MHLGKKRLSWNIRCNLTVEMPDLSQIEIPVTFTMEDFRHFVPPNGKVVRYNLRADLGSNYPKIKPGIYREKNVRALVWKTKDTCTIQAASDTWDTLKALLCKMLSDAGVAPRVRHKVGTRAADALADWTEALFELFKK